MLLARFANISKQRVGLEKRSVVMGCTSSRKAKRPSGTWIVDGMDQVNSYKPAPTPELTIKSAPVEPKTGRNERLTPPC